VGGVGAGEEHIVKENRSSIKKKKKEEEARKKGRAVHMCKQEDH
jgi:hypothetical protein